MQIVYSDRIFDEPDTQKIFQFINEYAPGSTVARDYYNYYVELEERLKNA